MSKSIRVHQKRRGRPATGRDPAVTVRIPKDVLAQIDHFAENQSEPLSRSEAIRHLVEQALARKRAARPPNKETARKAAHLAAREIEPLEDKSAPPEEQRRRKRRLIRGPGEFRDIRSDQNKKKAE